MDTPVTCFEGGANVQLDFHEPGAGSAVFGGALSGNTSRRGKGQ
jgi:hypothetical protein